MEPIRIPLTSNLPAPSTTRQVDSQQPVKQLQQEDQVQFSAESEQVSRLKSEMDGWTGRLSALQKKVENWYSYLETARYLTEWYLQELLDLEC